MLQSVIQSAKSYEKDTNLLNYTISASASGGEIGGCRVHNCSALPLSSSSIGLSDGTSPSWFPDGTGGQPTSAHCTWGRTALVLR